MRSLFGFGALFVVAGLFGAGCTPSSQYRYTGMVPAARPIPFDGRTAEKGTVVLEGSMTTQSVERNVAPVLHDSALHVPELTVDGSAAYAVSDHIELGVRLSYARYGWTEETAAGTPPLPDKPSMLGAGPEMRAKISLDQGDLWTLGIAWNLMRWSMPIAEWQKTGSCAPGPSCYVDPLTATVSPTYYQYASSTTQEAWLLSLSVLLSRAFGEHGEYGHVFGGFAFHQTFGNDGFTDSTSSNGQVQTKGYAPIVTAGYGIRLRPMRIGASLFLPMGGDSTSIMWGFGGQLTLGVELGGPSDATEPQGPPGPPPPVSAPNPAAMF